MYFPTFQPGTWLKKIEVYATRRATDTTKRPVSSRVASRCVTMHGVLLPRQQSDQRPEGVLFIHVDEQQSCDLTHALAVAHLLQTHSWSDDDEFIPNCPIFSLNDVNSVV